jgi:hypothetical protein
MWYCSFAGLLSLDLNGLKVRVHATMCLVMHGLGLLVPACQARDALDCINIADLGARR